MILWRNFQNQFTCCCLLYVGLRFVLLSISLFHCILLSIIPHHIHNENSRANVLFWAVHELGCHIIFQSWTWRWWILIFCWPCISIYLSYINQLDALNFTSLFHASTCFEHKCSSSGGQNCTIQSLVSSHL